LLGTLKLTAQYSRFGFIVPQDAAETYVHVDQIHRADVEAPEDGQSRQTTMGNRRKGVKDVKIAE
jgi:cold shock CspA family protein